MISEDSECVLQPNQNVIDGFQAISFINGIETRDGGVHVDVYSEAIFRPLLEALNKAYRRSPEQLLIVENAYKNS